MIQYTLRLDQPATHLFGVEIALETNGAPYLDLEFPAWSPGRYFIYDFARNVQELRAHDAAGTALATEHVAKGTWRIHCTGTGSICIRYRMFGDTLSGTFSQLDDRHAAVNGSSVFGYVIGRSDEPIELRVEAPEHWRVYTALKRRRRAGSTVFIAANYDQLIDSPLEIGTPIHRRFQSDGVTYHVVIDLAGVPLPPKRGPLAERLDKYMADLEKIVRAYTSTFGKPELDDYYFLVNVDPYAASGDGMEHQASTRLVMSDSIMSDDVYADLLDVSSHEFFHLWNVKRLRPVELGPFDYAREHHTTLLWFAEGFTQYYGHLMVRRAGIWDDREFYKHLVAEVNQVDRSPGRFHRNLRESSFDTWFALSARNPAAATSNFKNTYVNYYYKGAVTALLLDLEIRKRTSGQRSLDDLIRELYRATYAEAEEGNYYLRGNGYTEQDVLAATERVAGRAAREYLQRLIVGTEEMDYEAHLAYVGLDLVRAETRARSRRTVSDTGGRQVFTGIVVADARDRAADPFVRVLNVLEPSPASIAGISAGDQILAIDGQRVDGKQWDRVLGTTQPGDTVELTCFRGPRLRTTRLTIAERDTRPYRIEPRSQASESQKRAREHWLTGISPRPGGRGKRTPR